MSHTLIGPIEFYKRYLTFILNYPPDNFLFPFLHGIESANNAQTSFFSSSQKVTIPNYRGLIWVVCEDDLDDDQDHYSLLTSTFFPRDIITPNTYLSHPIFLPPDVPNGISLRNFGIQLPIFATISDIVVYSPKGVSPAAIELASKFRSAITRKATDRLIRLKCYDPISPQVLADNGLLSYNVYILDATAEDIYKHLPHLIARYSHEESLPGLPPNTINFAWREKVEMRELTKASEILTIYPHGHPHADSDSKSHWDPALGQVFLGNSSDLPKIPTIPGHRIIRTTVRNHVLSIKPAPSSPSFPYWDPYPPSQSNSSTPVNPESPFDYSRNDPADGLGYDICIECLDYAELLTDAPLALAEAHINELERLWAEKCAAEGEAEQEPERTVRVRPPPHASAVLYFSFPSSPRIDGDHMRDLMLFLRFLERMLQTPSSPPSPPPSPSPTSPPRTRPLKILIHSRDGYTESSILALSLLMALRGLTLPEAYLELQVEKARSFFVHQADVGVLKRVEEELKAGGLRAGALGLGSRAVSFGGLKAGIKGNGGKDVGREKGKGRPSYYRRPPANSVSSAQAPVLTMFAREEGGGSGIGVIDVSGRAATMSQITVGAVDNTGTGIGTGTGTGPVPPIRSRPRASTSPWLPSLFPDHQAWFDDPRFDGSFPSRVLPFLYLGNLCVFEYPSLTILSFSFFY